ncbi:MAG: type II toxin-antitoxin system HicB family antitoxin [Prevotellaceae bacterium]|jgi:predicted RNase H-like HicB family nuclease|nr:type II toxin-antitoxin system HicB family antitoxin [Prevotellaceae bacterium]
MKKLKVIIEKSADYYDAYARNCEGIYGAGKTAEAAKENLMKGLQLYINNAKDLPDILKGQYQIEYTYDIQSFLNYYAKILSKSGLEKVTGINQKQLGHYANGNRVPRMETVRKIESSLQDLGKELCQVHFCS